MTAIHPEDVVRRFCNAWERRDIDAILGLVTEDIVYQNVPRLAYIGKAEVAQFISPVISDAVEIEFKLLAIATVSNSRSVLTERVDRIHLPQGVVNIPLMGLFEVTPAGLIAAWRDYPDSQYVAKQFAAFPLPAKG
jgi:limonene-1,2-epoxide hydrolase